MAPDNKQSSDVEQASDIESQGETEGTDFSSDEEITTAAKRSLCKDEKLIMNAMKEVAVTNKSKDDVETGKDVPSLEDTKNPDFKNDVPTYGVIASPPLSAKKESVKGLPLDLETGKEAIVQEEDDKEGQGDAEEGCLSYWEWVLLCLTISLLTVPILWLTHVINYGFCNFLVFWLGVGYIVSFCKSNRFQYRQNTFLPIAPGNWHFLPVF